jgi:hypothetical protein
MPVDMDLVKQATRKRKPIEPEKVPRADAAIEKPLGMRTLVPTLHRLLTMDTRACA